MSEKEKQHTHEHNLYEHHEPNSHENHPHQQHENQTKRYIITGGPGAGKTSIIEGLKELGYNVLEEKSRYLIDEEQKKESDLVPWKDFVGFNKKLLSLQIDQHKSVDKGVHFFDRGIPDNVGYFWNLELEVLPELVEAANTYRYEPIIFFTPPWKEIYKLDDARKEKFEDAVKISEHIKNAYAHFGYKIIEVPKTTVKERVEFIRKHVL